MSYNEILDEALNELRAIVQSLRWAEVAILASSPIQKRSAQIITSSSYVLIAAATENFFRKTLCTLIKDIRSSGALKREIKSSLHSIFGDHHLASFRDLRDYQKSWEKRIELFELPSSAVSLNDSPSEIPLDGKTIRPVHLEIIWQVFALPSKPFPNLQCRAALIDIADGRNEVAHGHISVSTFSMQKGTTDTIKKISRIEELLTHTSLQAIAYIGTTGYLK
jgi:hypothetical protein